MSSLKYTFAYSKSKEITTIEEAIKGVNYYLTEDLQCELLVAQGDVMRKHFRAVSDSAEWTEFNRLNESPEHYNAKMKIVYDGGITIDGTFLKAIKVKAEVWIPSIKMQPDVVFLDENDKPYFIVEVKRSNAKSIEDINKLNTLNIPVYEKDINDNSRSEFICLATQEETEEYSTIKSRVERANEVVESLGCKIQRDREALRTLYKHRGKVVSYKQVEKAEETHEENKREIPRLERLLRENTEELEQCEDKNSTLRESIQRVRDREVQEGIERFNSSFSREESGTEFKLMLESDWRGVDVGSEFKAWIQRAQEY